MHHALASYFKLAMLVQSLSQPSVGQVDQPISDVGPSLQLTTNYII